MAASTHYLAEFKRRASNPPTLNAFSFDIDAAEQRLLIGTWMVPTLHRAGGGPPLQFFEGHEGTVVSVALSPDGRHALSGGMDQTVRLWDVSTGECLFTLKGHNSEVTSVRFSPDGTFALSCGFGEIRRWCLDWELSPPGQAGWDPSAQPHLEAFLERHRPCEEELPLESALPSPAEIRKALTRAGEPIWTESDFESFMRTLGGVGLGWLGPEVVKRELRRKMDQLRSIAATSTGRAI